ncbi:MAG: hypothetical protein IPG74_03515 [Flavobacteriales bacterium]|nr:hypothetical protein [Flavobacteriales bacterium]
MPVVLPEKVQPDKSNELAVVVLEDSTYSASGKPTTGERVGRDLVIRHIARAGDGGNHMGEIDVGQWRSIASGILQLRWALRVYVLPFVERDRRCYMNERRIEAILHLGAHTNEWVISYVPMKVE